MDWKDFIRTDPKIMAGKPVIVGTRLTVDHVVGLLANGLSEAEIVGEYEISPEQIRACLAYTRDSTPHRDRPARGRRGGMSSSGIEITIPAATHVSVSEDTLSVDLSDGRSISAPLAWFPRLAHGSRLERKYWQLIGHGEGIRWPELDEDISVEGLIAGQPSRESQRSFAKWLDSRAGRSKRATTRVKKR